MFAFFLKLKSLFTFLTCCARFLEPCRGVRQEDMVTSAFKISEGQWPEEEDVQLTTTHRHRPTPVPASTLPSLCVRIPRDAAHLRRRCPSSSATRCLVRRQCFQPSRRRLAALRRWETADLWQLAIVSTCLLTVLWSKAIIQWPVLYSLNEESIQNTEPSNSGCVVLSDTETRCRLIAYFYELRSEYFSYVTHFVWQLFGY